MSSTLCGFGPFGSARATCHLAYLSLQIFGVPTPCLLPCSINFHNRWLNKATHIHTHTRLVSLTSHGMNFWGGGEGVKSQPVYDAHTFRFMAISLFCFGGSLALFELCLTYFYSLNTFSPQSNQIMAYLPMAEVKTQIAINM